MSARIEKLKQLWSDSRLLSLPGISTSMQAATVWKTLEAADVTSKKIYVQWLLDVWERKLFLWEDIRAGRNSEIAQTISDFERLKKKLDVKARSLTAYKNPGELWMAIKPFLDEEQENGESLSSRQVKRNIMEKARIESQRTILANGVIIDRPFSAFAACALGRNTKWCTSAKNDNAFHDYAESGPIFIITLPNRTRFQFHIDVDTYLNHWEIDDLIESMREKDENEEAFYSPYKILYGMTDFASSHTLANEADNSLSLKECALLKPYCHEIFMHIAQEVTAFFNEENVENDCGTSEEYSQAYSQILFNEMMLSLDSIEVRNMLLETEENIEGHNSDFMKGVLESNLKIVDYKVDDLMKLDDFDGQYAILKSIAEVITNRNYPICVDDIDERLHAWIEQNDVPLGQAFAVDQGLICSPGQEKAFAAMLCVETGLVPTLSIIDKFETILAVAIAGIHEKTFSTGEDPALDALRASFLNDGSLFYNAMDTIDETKHPFCHMVYEAFTGRPDRLGGDASIADNPHPYCMMTISQEQKNIVMLSILSGTALSSEQMKELRAGNPTPDIIDAVSRSIEKERVHCNKNHLVWENLERIMPDASSSLEIGLGRKYLNDGRNAERHVSQSMYKEQEILKDIITNIGSTHSQN